MKIGIVQLSMKKLRQKIEKAINALSRDSTGSISQTCNGGVGSGSTAASTTTSHFASEASISACEEACSALSVTETMLARATSLLAKFPGQYGLVSDLLRFADGCPLGLTTFNSSTRVPTSVFTLGCSIAVAKEPRPTKKHPRLIGSRTNRRVIPRLLSLGIAAAFKSNSRPSHLILNRHQEGCWDGLKQLRINP